eukprot:CAMPEP_0185448260 /NCGR_PEP_ID=MMETSP1365-20130426/58329_1 /TAXON_ID=38817 /ORGANISM="Gephyrocapsa oceanica, Strain RCC1303" /LENGTH=54 /DNA_ID=CAMNT_0028054201 /DNA_START=142 /DNA_END=303 /DNA_ORIENTATION=-
MASLPANRGVSTIPANRGMSALLDLRVPRVPKTVSSKAGSPQQEGSEQQTKLSP